MYPFLLAAATIGDKIDSTFYDFDMWVYHIFGAMQNGFFTQVAKIFTAIGDERFVIPIAVLGLILCFFKKTRRYGLAIVFAIAIGTLVTNIAVKPIVLRIRPYNTLQNAPIWGEYEKWYVAAGSLSESDYSFPSGHTTAAFEMAVAVALCMRKDGKKALSWLLPVIALCTMGSRVYLMVHYPTDVLGGLLVGTLAGVLGYLIATLLCKKLFEKTALDKIDLEKISKNGFSKKIVAVLLALAVCGAYAYSYIPALSEGGAECCAYHGEDYDCKNEARDDKKYYAFDGDGDGKLEKYCKIHWNQLHGDDKG